MQKLYGILLSDWSAKNLFAFIWPGCDKNTPRYGVVISHKSLINKDYCICVYV